MVNDYITYHLLFLFDKRLFYSVFIYAFIQYIYYHEVSVFL